MSNLALIVPERAADIGLCGRLVSSSKSGSLRPGKTGLISVLRCLRESDYVPYRSGLKMLGVLFSDTFLA